MTESERKKQKVADEGSSPAGGRKTSYTVLRWRIAVLVLCTIGAALSADLVRLHVRVHTDPDYHSLCAVAEWANCETVAESEQSVAFGMPVAIWGLLVYLALGALTAWGIRRPISPPAWPFGMLFWLCLISSGVSIYLFFLSHMVIESVCLVCMGTYAVNIALTVLCWVELRRLRLTPFGALGADLRSVGERPVAFGLSMAVFAVAAGVLWLTVPPYWQVGSTRDHVGLPTGVTSEGFPWIGSRTPSLVIAEFSDYQCPHCRRGHEQIRQLIQEHPDEVRLVHRQYPLDQACNRSLTRPFHPYACAYAKLSYCAEEQGRFWEANDFLFENGRRKTPVTTKELAEAIEIETDLLNRCMTSSSVAEAIEIDLTEGRSKGIRGTPTFVIGDETYPGGIPPEVLARHLGTAAQ